MSRCIVHTNLGRILQYPSAWLEMRLYHQDCPLHHLPMINNHPFLIRKGLFEAFYNGDSSDSRGRKTRLHAEARKVATTQGAASRTSFPCFSNILTTDL